MAKNVADYSNTAGTGHPPGGLASNNGLPVISTQGHSAKPLDANGK